MFRPAHIGPWPVYDLEVQNWTPNAVAVPGRNEDQLVPTFLRAAPRGNYDSLCIEVNTDWFLAQSQNIAFGLMVDGAMPRGVPAHVVYALSASVVSEAGPSDADDQCALQMRPWIARPGDSVPLRVGSQPAYAFREDLRNAILLPYTHHGSFGGHQEQGAVNLNTRDRQFNTMSAVGQCVLIDKSGNDFSAAGSQNPIVIAVQIMSAENDQGITLRNIAISMSLHRYEDDIETFSASR